MPADETREFFSKIPSEEMLKSVIETIFDLGDKTGKAKELYNKSHAYIKLWGLYKRTDERRKEKRRPEFTEIMSGKLLMIGLSTF